MTILQKAGINLRRCRDYHLYDQKGRRLLDMNLGGGRCLFGHKPRGLGSYLKRVLDQGLASAYSSVYQDRLSRFLQKQFPAYQAVFFPSPEGMEEALQKYGISSQDFYDPANPGLGKNQNEKKDQSDYQIYRYFLSEKPSASLLRLMVPYPGPGSAEIILFRQIDFPDLPSQSWVSPIVLAGLYYMLDHADIFINELTSSLRSLPENPLFKQKGPYLQALFPPQKMKYYQDKFLDNGILISDDYKTSSILPLCLSDGEFYQIIKCCGGVNGT